MSELVIVNALSLVGTLVAVWFTFKSLKATLKNNLDLAILQLKEKQKETHDLVNSRMSELLELTKTAWLAKGIKQEKDSPTTGNGGSAIPNAETVTIKTVNVEKLVADKIVDKKEEIPERPTDDQLSQTK